MFKKITIIAVIVLVVATAIFFVFSGSSSSNEQEFTLKTVEKGNVVDKAMAIGQIEPEHEVMVKSQISGIVSKMYADVGDRVEVGDPLFDIAPQPTPIEFAEAKRQVELSAVSFENAEKNYNRVKGMFEKNLVSESDLDDAQNTYEQAAVQINSAKEKLSLIEKGKTQIAGRTVENVIRSPITGMILQRNVEEGDPVVPLTSYQSGTELMTLAQMDDLIFRGTVDEIDVGKLKQDMEVQLQIGAIPKDTIHGILRRISPKARKQDNTTVFDVEVTITSTTESVLRAGYSANAEVIVAQKDSVLVVPERLVTFTDDSTFVDIQDSTGGVVQHPVEVGLSDGIYIEIVSGLEEGQEIVEKPPKTIE
ncbi:MAG: efflux RND transporter periplasmic adaptor subunit [candidate division Zixibacteria bacterium]|nr:efflux RND transporter periplasmic adaptor subunit [candidate division Zixibacteria bacterium]MBU1471035.1 efflux RND transporter periplasmic adaptor subunit [candidate division Zixibacteria bacterium]MBU2625070.1 efflux RND transporter periplasmic adaptor subunit [candidate division Zixibacteria bacterium]